MVDEYLNEIERKEAAEEAAKDSNTVKAAQQGKKKRQRIPGVEIAQVVDPSSVQRKEPSKLGDEAINTKDWVMRQFTFIDAMCECSAKQAYNYWVGSKQDKPLMTNIEFRHAMMVQLINNPEWKRAQQIGESNFVDQSIPGPPVCKLKHYDKGRWEWDRDLKDYKFPAQEYQ
jgi:hypothetical protein